MTHHSSCSSPRSGKGCASGRGQTGCAFRGAKMALQPIADAAHLVHGPASCEMGSWEFRPTRSSGPLLHRLSLTTDMDERDIVLGGESRLAQAIEQIIERFQPPALFVYQTCQPGLIGDDLAAVCLKAEQRWAIPVIPVDVPGFAGSRPWGNHLAAKVLLERVVGTVEPAFTTPTDINLIGEFNLGGETMRIRTLLSALGIRVLASLSGDGRYREVATAHRARLSVLLCSQGMASLAEGLRRRWNIPVIEGSFHGSTQCADLLRRLAAALAALGGPADLPQRAEALVRREQDRAEFQMADLRRQLTGKRVLVRCGGAKTWSLIETLRAAGMVVVGSNASKVDAQDRLKLQERLGLHSEPSDPAADIVLSGGAGQYEAMKQGTAWLEVNHQRDFALTGFNGGLELLRRIAKALTSPVWAELSRDAPWGTAP